MSDKLTTQNNSISSYSINIDKIRTLKTTIMPKNATDADLELFIEYCKRTQLDPFARQIYAIDMQGKLSIQTSIDGFRVIAQRTGEYRGQEIFWCDDTGTWKDVWLLDKAPTAAKVLIYRDKLDKPVAGIALYREYYRDTPIWKKMPSTMLAKCAESLAFRKAFPNELSGLYTQEEMEEVNNKSSNKSNKNNVIDITTSSIDNSTYDEKTDKYIDYNICGTGDNEGKYWIEVDKDTLKKALEYYKKRKDKNYIETINFAISLQKEGYTENVKNNACKNDDVIYVDRNNIIQKLKIKDDIYKKDLKTAKVFHYFIYDENGIEKEIEASTVYRVLTIARARENRELDLNEKYTKRKIAEGKIDAIHLDDKNNVIDIKVNEDEDPFSDANGDDWDDMINEQENNEKNINQIDHEDKEFNLDN